MASRKRLIVGIDFGTTKTCVAYTRPGAGGIELVGSWFMDNTNNPVVPSRIGYNEVFQPDRNVNSLEFADEAMREMLRSGVLHIPAASSPRYVISDFLRYVHVHISDHIPEIDRNDTQVEYYFTVPATWPQETRDALRSAANGAQFGSAVQRERNALEPGDGLLVCHCGGGTVDITACSILSVNPTLHFQQITASTGGMCGSTAVDFRFYQLLIRELGDAFLDLPSGTTRPRSVFMNWFERARKSFHENESRMSYIPLKIKLREGAVYSDIYDARESPVVLAPGRMKELFDPVVDRTRALVLTQIHKAHECGRLINVRSLLSSRMPRLPLTIRPGIRKSSSSAGSVPPLISGPGWENRLRENKSCVVIPQKEPHLAVVRGAVLYGPHFADGPTWHCTRTYGVAVANMPAFEPLWILKKGEPYRVGMPNHASITIAHTHEKSLVYEIGIYKCSLVNPQHRVDSDYQIARNGVIVCDFNERQNRSAYPYPVVAGQTLYTLHVDVEVTFVPADRSLYFVVCSQGQEVGRGQLGLPVE
ncbi:hypothetical protein BJX96DRAFT_177437 [Aspergillus floccosus]